MDAVAFFPEHLNMQHLETRQLRKHYAAIWKRATALPSMQLITAMLAWAEQADGLRLIIAAQAKEGRNV